MYSGLKLFIFWIQVSFEKKMHISNDFHEREPEESHQLIHKTTTCRPFFFTPFHLDPYPPVTFCSGNGQRFALQPWNRLDVVGCVFGSEKNLCHRVGTIFEGEQQSWSIECHRHLRCRPNAKLVRIIAPSNKIKCPDTKIIALINSELIEPKHVAKRENNFCV